MTLLLPIIQCLSALHFSRLSIMSEAGHDLKYGKFLKHMAFGTTMLFISKTATAPVTRIRRLQQSQNEIVRAGFLARPYSGAIDCMRQIYQSEGFLSFWRGNLASCLVSFSAHSLDFALKQSLKSDLNPSPHDQILVSIGKKIGLSLISGTISLAVIYSFRYATHRLLCDVKTEGKRENGRQFNGFIDVYCKTVGSDGLIGVYRGFFVSCFGILVYRGLYFGLCDGLKQLLGDNPSAGASGALGFLATVLAGVIAYPLDTIRCRMMMRSCEAEKYDGAIDCARTVITNEGFWSLMSGIGLSFVEGISGMMIMVLYSKVKGARGAN